MKLFPSSPAFAAGVDLYCIAPGVGPSRAVPIELFRERLEWVRNFIDPSELTEKHFLQLFKPHASSGKPACLCYSGPIVMLNDADAERRLLVIVSEAYPKDVEFKGPRFAWLMETFLHAYETEGPRRLNQRPYEPIGNDPIGALFR